MAEQNSPISIRRLASLDALTLLYNQAYFRRAAARRIERSNPASPDLTLLLLDVDDFKGYNDRFGAKAGDVALQYLADLLQEAVRADDLLARYGSDEFAILMIGHPEAAAATAERIRATVESRGTPAQNPDLKGQFTVSVGVATLATPLATLDALVEAVEREVGRAKQAGRNRISVAASS